MRPLFRGPWNRALGWALLAAGFAGAIWLDPWSLGQRDPVGLAGSPRMAARHAQAVVLGMAFLQIIVGELLATALFPDWVERAASWLTGGGALLYSLGYALLGHWAAGVWLVPVGALLNFLGFAALAAGTRGIAGRVELKVMLPVFCFGMLLDLVMGLFAADPVRLFPAWLGAEDGLPLRLLRLARAAVIALSLLALLYTGLSQRRENEPSLVRWGGIAMLFGAVAMPLVLTVTAFTSPHVKYLLPLPAQAVFLGSVLALLLAWRRKTRLEVWGWLLIVVGISGGLLMGLYAFDGPLPAPGFVGAYNDFPRRLVRLSHAYCIVLGLASILLARDLGWGYPAGWLPWLGVPLFVAGGVLTLAGLMLVAALELPTPVLAVGPALLTAALLWCRVAADSREKAATAPE